jgi:hypothetical protein
VLKDNTNTEIGNNIHADDSYRIIIPKGKQPTISRSVENKFGREDFQMEDQHYN